VRHEQKLSHYINAARSLSIEKYDKKIRVALLGSFTLNGMEETLRVKCSENDIGCITYVAGYDQYNQEILNSQSNLYKFEPDITFLILDTRSILGKIYDSPYTVSDTERKRAVEKKLVEIYHLIKSFYGNSGSKLVITNLSVPSYSPYGIYETKIVYGLRDMIIDFNAKINSTVRSFESVYLYDFDSFVRKYGENNVFDFRQFFIGDIKVSFEYIPYLIHDLVGYIKVFLGLNKKCIVLDLDNTLWGGIVGEDGFEGINLGDTPEGKAFVEFQKILFALHKRGIILAINSKNNADDAIKVIKEHPNMVLREENFSSVRINWNDKVANMKEIADELNIGLDSMIFFDDEPVNREYMRLSLPQVLTVDLADDTSEYAQDLMDMNDFHVLKITEEDIGRGKMYLEERQRKELEKSATNLEDFLKQLDIKILIKNANEFTIPRISQLTLKTNQFNLTTKRYQEEGIRDLVHKDNYWIGCAQVEDKFGDNGITGVFIIKKEKSEWIIDTFLLSCRIMGRKIEDGILAYILQKAKQEGANTIKGTFIPTKKNKPCENFLSDFGFKKENNSWIYTLTNPIKIPDHLSCSVE